MDNKDFSHQVAAEMEALRLVEAVEDTINGTYIVFICADGTQKHFRGSFALQQAASPAHRPVLFLYEQQPENALSISDLLTKGAC